MFLLSSIQLINFYVHVPSEISIGFLSNLWSRNRVNLLHKFDRILKEEEF
jgi:hypothetical protein